MFNKLSNMKTYIQLENTHSYKLPLEYQDDDVRYSESLVEYFLDEYTNKRDIVFDPFAGFGTTLLVAESMGRIPFGIEYDEDRVLYIRSKLNQSENIIHGDSRQLLSYGLPAFNFSITSPPYMSKYDKENPFTAYTTIGEGYQGYLRDIRSIYKKMAQLMAIDSTIILEVANIKKRNYITTVAWDIANEISQVLKFEGEIIVNWDNYGSGYDHSYCLIFTKPA